VQSVVSTFTGIAAEKHCCTSKQPLGAPPSTPARSDGVYVGKEDSGTFGVSHDPWMQVVPSGHVEVTAPSASACAVPTHR
jgi:hypothetical protein